MTTEANDPLSPTSRTTLGRLAHKGRSERESLYQVLADGLVAHLGVDAGDHPVVLPTAYAVDPDGPDRGGTLYVHGSVAARWLLAARTRTVCVTVTELDGLVAARSGFEHSMNYRSAVVIGVARLVEDPDEQLRALDLIVDHMIPGRAETLRRPTRKEMAATQVLAVPMWEASVKVRSGGPEDEPDDIAATAWGGHIPLRRVAGDPVADEVSRGPAPDDVRRRADSLR